MSGLTRSIAIQVRASSWGEGGAGVLKIMLRPQVLKQPKFLGTSAYLRLHSPNDEISLWSRELSYSRPEQDLVGHRIFDIRYLNRDLVD